MKMAGILLIYILGIYFLLTKMVQLEDEDVVGCLLYTYQSPRASCAYRMK